MLGKIYQSLSRALFRNRRHELRPAVHRLFSSEQASTPAGGRILLGYTCKICETRSHRTISQQAYTKGVVLVECAQCKSRHLIADNLGWFEQRGDSRTVEEILARRGETVRRSWTDTEHGAVMECLAEATPQGEAKQSIREPEP